VVFGIGTDFAVELTVFEADGSQPYLNGSFLLDFEVCAYSNVPSPPLTHIVYNRFALCGFEGGTPGLRRSFSPYSFVSLISSSQGDQAIVVIYDHDTGVLSVPNYSNPQIFVRRAGELGFTLIGTLQGVNITNSLICVMDRSAY